MPTSTIMLIYEIVNNEYKVESKTLCCRHNWIRVFAHSGTGREASCSLRYSVLFLRGKSPRVEVPLLEVKKGSKSSPKKRSPISCGFSLFIWERETFYLPFSAAMMTLSVIEIFSFCCIFFWSYYLVFGMSLLTSYFELIGGVVIVETSCLSSSELRSLFTQIGLHICLLFILAFG